VPYPDPIDPNADIPEQDRDAARRAAQKSVIDYKRLRPIDIACILISMIGAFIVWLATERVLASLGWSAPVWILPAFGTVCFLIATSLFHNRRYRKLFYAELHARGHNVCPKCGYLRAGLEDTAPCPECGTTIGAA
jgi:hypothetical protein